MKGDDLIVQTEALTREYGDGTVVRALDGVSLSISRGEFVAIVGPSGSGTSTLLNLIGTLDNPTSGRIVIDGVDTGSLNGDALADFRREKLDLSFNCSIWCPRSTPWRM
jgi:putative ABC transport system ATP-binding protein